MYYAKFNNDGRVVEAHNNTTMQICPESYIELTEQQFNERFNLLLKDGQIINSTVDIAQSVDGISIAINKYLISTIRAMPFDYESVAELYAWCSDSDYGSEARSLYDWCIECQKIDFKIKTGVLVFTSINDALAALPALTITK